MSHYVTMATRCHHVIWASKLSDTCPFVTVEVAQLRGAFPVTCTSDVGRLSSLPFCSKCSPIVKDDIRINGWNPSRFLNLLSLLHQSHKFMLSCEDCNRIQHPVHVTIFVRVVKVNKKVLFFLFFFKDNDLGLPQAYITNIRCYWETVVKQKWYLSRIYPINFPIYTKIVSWIAEAA